MNPNIILLAIGAIIAAMFIGAGIGAFLKRQPVSKVEVNVDQELFAIAVGALEKLADTSAERKTIAAANQRIALKTQLMGQAVQHLSTPAPQAPQ